MALAATDSVPSVKCAAEQEWHVHQISHGNVKERYFSHFNKRGLQSLRQASQERWPQWAEDAIK
jgi:hypothetical protein